jgi:predicted TIM-barrel fold metal-dependent hydrolase
MSGAISQAAPVSVMRDVELVDCDVHPVLLTRRPDDPIIARLSRRARDYYDQVGLRGPSWPDFYPKMRPAGVRTDAFPPNGGLPGSDPEFLCQQLLDRHAVDFAILILLDYGDQDDDDAFRTELVTALNDAIEERFLDFDDRLRGSILVPFDNPAAAIAELERRAGDHRWVQVAMPSWPRLGLEDRHYWPIYEAAAEHGLPIAFHGLGFLMKHSWSSYYIEDHLAMYTSYGPSVAVRLIASGVFDAVPDLRVVSVELGAAWASSLVWSMDAIWDQFPLSAPALERHPSDYLHDHFWFTSQPIEEPRDPADLERLLQHARLTDRLLFSSDYPHWDFDSPSQALPRALSPQTRRAILATNARDLYRLPKQVPVSR